MLTYTGVRDILFFFTVNGDLQVLHVLTHSFPTRRSSDLAVDKPVAIFAPAELITEKHARLHEELYAKGYAKPLGETVETATHAPLNAATDIAAAKIGRAHV